MPHPYTMVSLIFLLILWNLRNFSGTRKKQGRTLKVLMLTKKFENNSDFSQVRPMPNAINFRCCPQSFAATCYIECMANWFRVKGEGDLRKKFPAKCLHKRKTLASEKKILAQTYSSTPHPPPIKRSTPGGWGVAPTLSLGALVPQSILCPYPFSDYSGKTYSPFWTNQHESHVPKPCTYLSGHLRAVHPPWGYHKTRFLTRLTFVNILLNPCEMTCTQQHHTMENIAEI